jgi:hypothetical protein
MALMKQVSSYPYMHLESLLLSTWEFKDVLEGKKTIDMLWVSHNSGVLSPNACNFNCSNILIGVRTRCGISMILSQGRGSYPMLISFWSVVMVAGACLMADI